MTELCLLGQLNCLFKIILGLARESYDHIGGKVKIGHMPPESIHDLHKGGGSVHPSHFQKNGIRSTLQAEVQVVGHPGVFKEAVELRTKTVGLQ